MKIGIVCPYNIYMPGGVQAHIEGQIKELRSRGHSVTLITPRPAGYTEDPKEGTVFVGRSTRIKAQQTWSDIAASVDTDVIDLLLEKSQFDIIHIHEPLIPFLASQILGRLQCPAIGTFHAAIPDTFLAKAVVGSTGPYKRGIMKHLSAVTAVSKAAADSIDDLVDPSQIIIIPNAIDAAQFALTANRDPNMILYIGRLEKRKGVKYLLTAFSDLLKVLPDATLIIAGDGPERGSLEAKVRSLKLSSKVKFLGHISDERKVSLLARCQVFTSPAVFGESFGIVLLEAAAAGAVTVAGNNPGYESVLVGPGRLSLVDVKGSGEYARRLELLMTEPALQAVWRHWAAGYVKNFSYSKLAASYEHLYEQQVKK
jgi:phosphatidylinositol alpha-mannosyltransferase